MTIPENLILILICISITFIISSLYLQLVSISEYMEGTLLTKTGLALASVFFHFLLIGCTLKLTAYNPELKTFFLACFALVSSGCIMKKGYNTYQKMKNNEEDDL